jgi:hypothetical protein
MTTLATSINKFSIRLCKNKIEQATLGMILSVRLLENPLGIILISP